MEDFLFSFFLFCLLLFLSCIVCYLFDPLTWRFPIDEAASFLFLWSITSWSLLFTSGLKMFMLFNKRMIMTETDNVDGPESYVDEEKNRLCVTWQLRIGSSRLFSAAHPSGPEIHIAMPLQPVAPIFKNLTLLSRCFSASSLCRCCSSCWRITMPGTSVEFLQYLQYLRPVFWRLGLCSWKLCLKNDDDDVVWKMIQPAERQISASRVGSEGGRGSSGNAGKWGKYKFIR